jgi:hypothetical protein
MTGIANRYYTPARGGVMYQADGSGSIAMVSSSQPSDFVAGGVVPQDIPSLPKLLLFAGHDVVLKHLMRPHHAPLLAEIAQYAPASGS